MLAAVFASYLAAIDPVLPASISSSPLAQPKSVVNQSVPFYRWIYRKVLSELHSFVRRWSSLLKNYFIETILSKSPLREYTEEAKEFN